MKKYSYHSYEQFLVDSRPNQASPRARGQRLVAGPPPPPRVGAKHSTRITLMSAYLFLLSYNYSHGPL